MAQRAPSLRACGCIAAVGAQCQHARARDKERPTARQRGYDTEYQQAAAAFLREHRRCDCGAPAVLVRHVISIRLRPDLRMDRRNWQPGCRSCNVKDAHRDKRETSS
jgi:5-methylcytosine-specific restriction protein A